MGTVLDVLNRFLKMFICIFKYSDSESERRKIHANVSISVFSHFGSFQKPKLTSRFTGMAITPFYSLFRGLSIN